MAGMICVAEVSAPEAFYEKGNTFFTGLLNLGAANYSWNPVFGCQLWLKNVAVEVYQICSETSRLRGSLFHPMTSLGEINGAQSHGLGTVQRKNKTDVRRIWIEDPCHAENVSVKNPLRLSLHAPTT